MAFNSVEIVLMETWSGLLVNMSFGEKEQATFRGNVIDTPIILYIGTYLLHLHTMNNINYY